jgi:hypothetical protein
MSWLGDDAEERWNRLATALLWIAILLGALALARLVQSGDVRGAVMTFVPGAIALGLWFLARHLSDAAASGHGRGIVLTIAGAVAAVVGVNYLATGRAPGQPSRHDDVDDHARYDTIELPPGELEVVDIPNPNGSGTIKSLARKRPPVTPAR